MLSIDKNHLASSIRGFYGSENINVDEYLRRFIDLEYSIPRPSTKEFCQYLYSYYTFDEFFLSQERQKHNELYYEKESFLLIAEILFTKVNATLRQQEKIFALSRLILRSFPKINFTFSPLLFFLAFLKTLNLTLYNKIEEQSLTLQELCDAFSDFMPDDIENKYGINLIYLQALLLVFYSNMGDYKMQKGLFQKDTEGNEEVVAVISKLEKNTTNLGNYIKEINRNYRYNGTNLNYLLTRVSLTEQLIIQ